MNNNSYFIKSIEFDLSIKLSLENQSTLKNSHFEIFLQFIFSSLCCYREDNYRFLYISPNIEVLKDSSKSRKMTPPHRWHPYHISSKGKTHQHIVKRCMLKELNTLEQIIQKRAYVGQGSTQIKYHTNHLFLSNIIQKFGNRLKQAWKAILCQRYIYQGLLMRFKSIRFINILIIPII